MSDVEKCVEAIDVAVVGAGPAGLTAGLYAARAGLRTVIFGDRYDAQLARADIVENYPTQIQPLTGVELVELLAQHAAKFDAQFEEREVRAIRKDGDSFYLFTAGGRCYPAYAVVLAMGTKRKQLGVPGEAQFYGQGVAYCTICDGPLFRNMPVAVIGAGDEGAAAALRMASIASSVDFVVPKTRLEAEDVLVQQLRKTPHMTIIESAKVEEIVGNGAGVSGVRITAGGEQTVRPVRGVFLELGLMPASSLAQDLGVHVTSEQFIDTGRFQETNVPGIYAAGDITGHRARQSVISAGEGATAAVSAVDYIKSHGLGGDRPLRLIQWGTAAAPQPAAATTPQPAARPAAPVAKPANDLVSYVEADAGYQQTYQAYQPDEATCERIRQALPRARVTVIAASWCGDCRRNIPKLARLCYHLPDWEFRVYPRESDEARELDVKAIPTVVVFDLDSGKELGRIVEDPKGGSYERDLLAIASSKRASVVRPASARYRVAVGRPAAGCAMLSLEWVGCSNAPASDNPYSLGGE